ncbi:FemAB family XrtA/PEP-CTERM system-associated protein [Marinobacter salicampi]|uniref:FemAB family XrtA/PEP-CTERM system-associated protein n=1 Tax=Marinobacter salicampi TaxID=435907 RepID=UPI00140D9279|nr:FemAB family XrtA/PEP-CTERM system-associated protein [Marinobacter salicampi]
MEELSTAEIEPSKQKIENLKALKGRLSRQIGEAKKAGDSADELISQLKSVSDEIKTLQKARKQALNSDGATQPGGEGKTTGCSPVEALSPVLNTSAKPVHRVVEDVRGTGPEAAWDDFVDQHGATSPYHKISVRRFIEQTYSHKTHYCCALAEDGEVLGVLPLVQLRSRLFGNFVVSVPYFNYGGLLTNSAEAAEKLLAAAENWRQVIGASHVELRHVSDAGTGLPARTDKVTFWLPLPGSSEELWQSFRPKLRAQVRRPEKEGAEVTIGGAELLDEFYDVFAANMRDLGTPVYSKRFFQNLLEQLGTSARLVIATLNGRSSGCAFLIGHAGRMEIPWASTLRESNATGINMLMYWKILEYSIGQGYQTFDFGRCSKDAGTYKFKQQWGATPVPLNWNYCLPAGEKLPELNPNNPKFRLMIAVWQRLPVWLTRLIGPPIVKSLP